jgi:hypothetical protein
MNLKNKSLFLISVALFILLNKVQCQTAVVLSYDGYLKNVIENNPLSIKANNTKKYGEVQYKAAKGNFDPFLNAYYDTKTFDSKSYYNMFSAAAKVPLYTAQNIKVGYDYGVGPNINPELQTTTFGLPFVGIEVGLLQGLQIDYRRAELLKAKEYVNYYSADKNDQLNILLFQSSLKYFDWLFSLKQMALTNYFLDLARQRLIGIEALANVGERPAMDTVEAAILYQTRLLEKQAAEIDIQKQSNDLSTFNWQKGGALFNVSYVPLDSIEFFFEKSKNSLIKKLYQDSVSNPIIAKYSSFQSILKIDNKLKREFIKPKLNVNYNFLSNNNTSFVPIYSANSFKWGLDFSFPLFFRKSVNDYKLSSLNFQNNGSKLTTFRVNLFILFIKFYV